MAEHRDSGRVQQQAYVIASRLKIYPSCTQDPCTMSSIASTQCPCPVLDAPRYFDRSALAIPAAIWDASSWFPFAFGWTPS